MRKNLETSKEVPKKTEALLNAYKTKEEIKPKETILDVTAVEKNIDLLEHKKRGHERPPSLF